MAAAGALGGAALLGVSGGALAAPPASAKAPSEYVLAATQAAAASLLAGEEPAWRAASRVEWGPAPYETGFRALWDASAVYLRWDARDAAPWHTMTHRDDHLWEEEVVEIFLDPGRAGHDYFELEISPANVVCDVRLIRPSPDKKYDLSWNLEGLETRVVPWRDASGSTQGWTAVARVPFPGLRSLPSVAAVTLPPRAGDRWRFNLFRVERPGGPEHPDQGAIEAAWSPTGEPSFHVPAAFRDFVFAASSAPSRP